MVRVVVGDKFVEILQVLAAASVVLALYAS